MKNVSLSASFWVVYSSLSIIATLVLLSLILPWIKGWDDTTSQYQYVNLSYASVGHSTTILSVYDDVNNQLIDEFYVVELLSCNDTEVRYIPDVSRRFRQGLWQEERFFSPEVAFYCVQEQKRFWLGTDGYGRDLAVRLLIGLRLSFLVGVLSMIISLVLGLLFGALSALSPSWLDQLVMFFINSVWSLPTIILAFLILLVVGSGLHNVIIALAMTLWIEIARMTRGELLRLRQLPYVQFSFLQGSSLWRIFWKHLLPNIWSPILVLCTYNFSLAILLEAGLSFLGFGVRPPQPSLGNILSENYALVISGYLVPALLPSLAILLLVFTFNILGNYLRDRMNVLQTV